MTKRICDFIKTIIFIPVILASAPSLAQDSEAGSPATFASALDALRKGESQNALDEFQVLLSRSPDDPALLTNAAIAAAQLNQLGLAAGLLRDSIELDPSSLQTRQALAFVMDKLPVKEIPHTVEFWELYRNQVLKGISLFALLAVGAPVLLLVGLLFLRWTAERRKAWADEEPLPPLRWIHGVAVILLALNLVLVISKLIDQGQVRGSILSPKIEARSAADASAPALFELFAGLEVLVLREKDDWVQVRYPGGPTGWVEKNALRISTISAH